MGIFKNPFGKKNKKPEQKGQLVLSMPMFQGDSSYSADKVIQDLQSHWGLKVDEVEHSDTTISFNIDGEV